MKKTRTALFSSLRENDTLFLPYPREEIDPFLLCELADDLGNGGTLLLPTDPTAARLYANGRLSTFFAGDDRFPFSPLERMLSLRAKVIDGEALPGALLLVRLAVSRFLARYLPKAPSLSEKDENGAPLLQTPDPSPILAKLTEERRTEEKELHGKKWLLYTANDLVNRAEALLEKDPAAYFGEALAAQLSIPQEGSQAEFLYAEERAFLDSLLPPKLFDTRFLTADSDRAPLSLVPFVGAREVFSLLPKAEALPDGIPERNRYAALLVEEGMTDEEIEQAIDADLKTACLCYKKPLGDENAPFEKGALLPRLMELANRRNLSLYIEGLTDEEDLSRLRKLYKGKRRPSLILPLCALTKGGTPPKALLKLSKCKRVYFDITAVTDPMPLALFINLFGTDRLLFGSGGEPLKNLCAFCHAAAGLHFTEREIASLLYENAASLFLS